MRAILESIEERALSTAPTNPYPKALDGLVFADPVAAFFDFCREREAIRLKRERGDPAPWSEDPIFQKGLFSRST